MPRFEALALKFALARRIIEARARQSRANGSTLDALAPPERRVRAGGWGQPLKYGLAMDPPPAQSTTHAKRPGTQ
ncbi:hypothetical protein DN745_02435 [Bradymonas sediminis]|uniref:Uncharacterized protein n=1 Tax=Bradymonas sediminis TaxID=1548548 RepID=A0A2Z4FHU6_9DELT|nr:hypothetical protein DN745_02435 [Bradymonas sediminis]